MIGMVAGITGDGSSQGADAIPSTMNDGAEGEDADESATMKPASASSMDPFSVFKEIPPLLGSPLRRYALDDSEARPIT